MAHQRRHNLSWDTFLVRPRRVNVRRNVSHEIFGSPSTMSRPRRCFRTLFSKIGLPDHVADQRLGSTGVMRRCHALDELRSRDRRGTRRSPLPHRRYVAKILREPPRALSRLRSARSRSFHRSAKARRDGVSRDEGQPSSSGVPLARRAARLCVVVVPLGTHAPGVGRSTAPGSPGCFYFSLQPCAALAGLRRGCDRLFSGRSRHHQVRDVALHLLRRHRSAMSQTVAQVLLRCAVIPLRGVLVASAWRWSSTVFDDRPRTSRTVSSLAVAARRLKPGSPRPLAAKIAPGFRGADTFAVAVGQITQLPTSESPHPFPV